MADPAQVPVGTGDPASSFDPISINYGLDNESYLTDEQKKLARMIQGKFDASTNRRDRELQRYGAPRLSSFVEDEALARAMTMAREFNTSGDDPLGTGINRGGGASGRMPGGGGGSGGGSGGGYRYPGELNPRAPARTGADAQTPAKWQAIMSGLTSLAPLLFGKDAFGRFMNEGLINTVKNAIFGPELAATLSPQALEQIVTQGGFPSDGAMVFNPITGMPMGVDPSGMPYGDPYGPGSGWGMDTWNPEAFEVPANPGWEGGDWGATEDMSGWEGGDWGWGGGDDDWGGGWDWGGFDDGGYVDYFGGV